LLRQSFSLLNLFIVGECKLKKRSAIEIIVSAAKIYDEQINGKNLLIIFGDVNKPSFIQTNATAANFLHLTGVSLNKAECNSGVAFFENARDKKLKENEFEFKDNTTEQKLNVLIQTLRIASNAKMIGDYNYKYIGYELKNLEINIDKKFAPKRQQTFDELSKAAKEKYILFSKVIIITLNLLARIFFRKGFLLLLTSSANLRVSICFKFF